MSKIKRFEQNTAGRDLVVGDIHGHFTLLQQTLDNINFNPAIDRLFSVGDLVDRGPESHKSIEWLNKPWFHAVCGNHEQMAINWMNPDVYKDVRLYRQNGGDWNLENTVEQQKIYADAFSELPLAIEIETVNGLVGVVHAEPTNDWDQLRDDLNNPLLDSYTSDRLRDKIQWERRRIYQGDKIGVTGVIAAVVGHTPLTKSMQFGNVYYIDTGAWSSAGTGFTFFDVKTLTTTTIEKD